MSLSEIETILSGGEIVPQSRIEKIIVGEDIVPQSRIEQLLKEILGGGGGSVPKPLTYDYMPEGYPKKATETVTVMEEQELEFAQAGGAGPYIANLTNAPVIAEGQTYMVNWDGTDYECLCFVVKSVSCIGNSSILGGVDDAGEPFIYAYNPNEASGQFLTLDPSASHTISVTTAKEVITPMAEEFLPTGIRELIMNSSTPDSTKKFKITVDDSGAISATEVT